MNSPKYEDLGHGIYCIDALYLEPDIACCYLVRGEGACALIETGTARSMANILDTLRALAIPDRELRYIIPTHVHLDHAGGAGALLKHFPHADLLIHPRGLKHLVDPQKLIASSLQVYGEETFKRLYGDITPADPARTHALDDGQVIDIGGRHLRVMHTRGHAEHHACFYDEQSRGWFTGDTFGISYRRQRHDQGSFVMPATTPTQFNPALYMESIDALAAAGPARMYLTHFGALDFHPTQVQLLKRQLQAYAEMSAEEDLSTADIEQRVLTISEEALAGLIPAADAATEAALLRMDAHLNAQGIAWWRQTTQSA